MTGFTKPARTIFNAEHDAFRDSVRGFLRREAVPRRERWLAEGIIDRDFWMLAAAQGFVGFPAPVRFGGMGVQDFRYSAILIEEVAYAAAGTDAFLMTNDIVGPYLWDLADEAQAARWLPGITSGAIVAAIAMTEPGCGSDLRAMQATARRDGDCFRINGAKTFITSGIQADLVIVAAKSDQQGTTRIGLFVVEADMAGFSRSRKLDKVGRRAQDTAELFFDDVVIPPENVLGDAADGFAHMTARLGQERLAIACSALANAEQALEDTVRYTRERRAFGQPVGSFQANRFAIARMATEIRVGRAYLDECIVRHDRGELPADEAAGAKYWTTELEWRVLDRCLQLHGGYGYMTEYEISTRWRDARVQRIYGGTSEIMQEIVGRSLGL